MTRNQMREPSRTTPPPPSSLASDLTRGPTGATAHTRHCVPLRPRPRQIGGGHSTPAFSSWMQNERMSRILPRIEVIAWVTQQQRCVLLHKRPHSGGWEGCSGNNRNSSSAQKHNISHNLKLPAVAFLTALLLAACRLVRLHRARCHLPPSPLPPPPVAPLLLLRPRRHRRSPLTHPLSSPVTAARIPSLSTRRCQIGGGPSSDPCVSAPRPPFIAWLRQLRPPSSLRPLIPFSVDGEGGCCFSLALLCAAAPNMTHTRAFLQTSSRPQDLLSAEAVFRSSQMVHEELARVAGTLLDNGTLEDVTGVPAKKGPALIARIHRNHMTFDEFVQLGSCVPRNLWANAQTYGPLACVVSQTPVVCIHKTNSDVLCATVWIPTTLECPEAVDLACEHPDCRIATHARNPVVQLDLSSEIALWDLLSDLQALQCPPPLTLLHLIPTTSGPSAFRR